MNCPLVRVVLYIINNLDPFQPVNLKVEHSETSQSINGNQGHIQSFDFDLRIPESTPLFVKLVNNRKGKVTSCSLNLYFKET